MFSIIALAAFFVRCASVAIDRPIATTPIQVEWLDWWATPGANSLHQASGVISARATVEAA